MVINIQCNAFDSGICRSQSADTAPFSAQILLLGIGQPFCGLLEPHINIFFIHLLLHKPSLVNQRNNRAIFHAVLNRILVDELTKFGQGILFPLHQRCPCEANIAGVRKYCAHFGSHGTIIGAMTFVNENEHVPGIVFCIQTFCGVEFIDNGSNHICFAVGHQFHQMPSAGCPGRIQPGMGKGCCNLTIQLFAVGYNDHTGIADSKLHQNVFGQHYHGQTLTTALGVPNHAALAVPFAVLLRDGFDDLPNGKILLIPADFLHISIKQNKVAGQLHQAFPAKQGNDISILFRGSSVCHQLRQSGVKESRILLFPYAPELLWGACCGVFHGVFVGCHDDLGILEQLGDIVCPLVANHLLHGLIHGNMGCFALNHRERNAVDKQNNVRTGIVKLILAFYSEFFRHMEQVVLRVFPVDVFQIEAERLSAAHSFRVAFAQQQSVIDLFAGAHQTIG